MKNQFFSTLVLLVGVLLFHSACQTDTKTDTAEVTKPVAITSGLYLDNMDKSVKPGDDFQAYVNGKWIKETAIPSDKSSYGIFAILQDESQDNVKKIIESSAEGTHAAGSDEQKVGGLYASYLDMDARNKLGNAPLQQEFKKIDAIANYTDLAKYFAYATKVGYNAPFGTFVMADLKTPNQHALYTWQGGLGLPDREYYTKDDEKSVQLRKDYVAHIEKMLTLAGVDKAAAASNIVMNLETTMANQHMTKEKTRDMMSLYNPVSVDSLKYLMPDFPWADYMAESGTNSVKRVIVPQLDYTKKLNKIINKTSLDTWKTYLKWSATSHNAGRLSADFDAENFNFFGTTLRGVKEQRPMWRRAVGIVNAYLGEVIGKVYVKRHFPPEAKEKMTVLVANLLKAYEVSIKDLDWMSADTKVMALEKIKKFNPKIGYPDKWKEYPAKIKKGDLFGNLQRSDLAEYDRNIGKLGKPVDKSEWGMNPQTINAYYNPSQNEIVFPAAILQPPFFDLNADDAVNYGAIGGVIGHEIGHGFDDQGSTFDGDGVLRDWWTEADKTEFKKRTGALVEQYNGFEVLDGLFINGEYTLGENIGDLGGLSIALKAYQMSRKGAKDVDMDGYNGLQRVFLGWAQAWRKKANEEDLRIYVATNTHSPAKFRVNGVVRNVPEFYEAFDVKEGDALYLAPEKRVKIW